MSQPTNPFEVEKYKREMIERKYRECEKDLKRRKKAEEKLSRIKARESNSEIQEKNEAKLSDASGKNPMAIDSQMFLLNQLAFSVQFFGNYFRWFEDEN